MIDPGLRRDGSDRREQLQAGQIRQPVVEHDDVDCVIAIGEQRDRRLAVPRFDDDIAVVAQRLGQRPPDQRLVVDDQDPDRSGTFPGSGKYLPAPAFAGRSRQLVLRQG